MLKYLFSLLLIVSLNSEAAGPRCFDLFVNQVTINQKQSVDHYADALDQMNAKYNNFLFSKKASDVLENGSRYQAYRLRKVLKELYQFDQFFNDKAALAEDHYAIEKLAVKLERLSFLNDESVTDNMTLSEKAIFRQAQHSLLAGGLAQFLFSGEPIPSASRVKKIMQPLLTVFKDVYFRWTYALAWMPKLNAAVIPYEVIEKVVIEGYDANHELLKPYLRTAQGKAAFNVFSSTYNWILAGALVFNLAHIADYTYHDVYLAGIAKAEQMLTPMLHDSEQMAKTDYAKIKFDKTFDLTITNFKIKYQREPNIHELQLLEQMVHAKINHDTVQEVI